MRERAHSMLPGPFRRLARWGVYGYWEVGQKRSPRKLRWITLTRRGADHEARRLECDPMVLSHGIGAVERTGHIGFFKCEVERLA